MPATGGLGGFRQGLASDLSNPKIAVLFTSLLPQFVAARAPTLMPFLLLGAIFVAMTLVWLCAYALLAARASATLQRPEIARARALHGRRVDRAGASGWRPNRASTRGGYAAITTPMFVVTASISSNSEDWRLEQAPPGAEHDRMDHQQVLVDQVGRDQLSDQLTAAEYRQRAIALLLELGDVFGGVADRRISCPRQRFGQRPRGHVLVVFVRASENVDRGAASGR